MRVLMKGKAYPEESSLSFVEPTLGNRYYFLDDRLQTENPEDTADLSVLFQKFHR